MKTLALILTLAHCAVVSVAHAGGPKVEARVEILESSRRVIVSDFPMAKVPASVLASSGVKDAVEEQYAFKVENTTCYAADLEMSSPTFMYRCSVTNGEGPPVGTTHVGVLDCVSEDRALIYRFRSADTGKNYLVKVYCTSGAKKRLVL